MTTPNHSQTIETREIKDILLLDNIRSLVEKLKEAEYLNNPILNKPIYTDLLPYLFPTKITTFLTIYLNFQKSIVLYKST